MSEKTEIVPIKDVRRWRVLIKNRQHRWKMKYQSKVQQEIEDIARMLQPYINFLKLYPEYPNYKQQMQCVVEAIFAKFASEEGTLHEYEFVHYLKLLLTIGRLVQLEALGCAKMTRKDSYGQKWYQLTPSALKEFSDSLNGKCANFS